MGTVKLMLALEAAYDLAIPDADLTPENFRTVSAIEAMVVRLRAACGFHGVFACLSIPAPAASSI